MKEKEIMIFAKGRGIKALLIHIFAIIVTAFLSYQFWIADPEGLFDRLMSLVALILFIVFLPRTIRLSIKRDPLLIINYDGFIDNASAAAVGFIPWEDVDTMSAEEHFVAVSLLDAERTLQNVSTAKSKLAGFNDTLGYGDLALDIGYSKYSAEDVLEIMQEYYNSKTLKSRT